MQADQRELLFLVLSELELFGERDPDELITRADTEEIRQCGIPYALQGPRGWFQEPLTNTQRKTYSRALKRLEKQNLIIRITEQQRDRVTHIQLTPAGLQRALVLAQTADAYLISEGLKRTEWGYWLGAQLAADLTE